LTREWCEEANIELNPDKSGILEIPPKGAKHLMEVGSKVEGIPIIREYKYLGLVLDNRLTGETHSGKLFGWKDHDGKRHPGKIEFIKNNLAPLLRKFLLIIEPTFGKCSYDPYLFPLPC